MKILVGLLIVLVILLIVVKTKNGSLRGVGSEVKWYILGSVLVFATFIGVAVLIINRADPKTTVETLPWNVDYMKYDELHKYSTGDSQVVGVIDTGVSSFQEDDSVKIIDTLNWGMSDYDGHGTSMVSLIKGEKEMQGIAPNCKIVVVSVPYVQEYFSGKNLEKAYKLMKREKIDVLSLSLGGPEKNPEVEECIKELTDRGVTVIAASGNDGVSQMCYPAALPNVISVGAIGPDLKPTFFTNAPSLCDILAPGLYVQQSDQFGCESYESGTSTATAIIAGYVALLKDVAEKNDKKLSNSQIREILNNIRDGKTTYLEALSEM